MLPLQAYSPGVSKAPGEYDQSRLSYLRRAVSGRGGQADVFLHDPFQKLERQ